MIVDGVGMAVSQGNMPMRMAVRLRPFPALVLVLVTQVKCVQTSVPQGALLVLKHLQIDKGP
jgi:hypothetical protein